MNRRHVLLLLGGAGFAAGLGTAAFWPRPVFGFGPVHIGMARNAALKVLGPEAFRAELCGGVDGALFGWPDSGFRTRDGGPVPVMAMFGGEGGAVSEIEASLSFPDGGWNLESWHDLAKAQSAELSRRTGMDATDVRLSEDELGAERLLVWRRPQGDLSLSARWMRRSGAAFTRLHWIAAGQESVIV